MKVDLIQNSGDDLLVVNAARVSFDKQSEWWYTRYGDGAADVSKGLNGKDEKLIQYLATHNHFTPFTHCTATFRITAPVAIARQLFKHKVGLTENEISRRYVDETPLLWWPDWDKWRLRAPNKKQGSSEETVNLKDILAYEDADITLFDMLEQYDEMAYSIYDKFIEKGIAPEQARFLLPQGMLTSWYWTGSLYAFSRVCNLRLQPDAQAETRMIAEQISTIMSGLYPVSWSALVKSE